MNVTVKGTRPDLGSAWHERSSGGVAGGGVGGGGGGGTGAGGTGGTTGGVDAGVVWSFLVAKAPTVKPAGIAGKTAVGPVGEMGATGASFLHSRACRTTSGSYSFVLCPRPTSSR